MLQRILPNLMAARTQPFEVSQNRLFSSIAVPWFIMIAVIIYLMFIYPLCEP